MLKDSGVTEPERRVLVPVRGVAAVHAGPDRRVPGVQGRPRGDRHQGRPEDGAVDARTTSRPSRRTGKAGIYLLGWTGDWADPSNFLGSFFGRANSPDWGYSDPAVQNGLKAALEEPDQAKRTQMYKDLNATIMDDLPGVPFVHNKSFLAFDKSVTGFVPSPVSLERFDAVDISNG